VSQPSVPFLSLVPGTGLLDPDAVFGGLAGVCNIHHNDSAITATKHKSCKLHFPNNYIKLNRDLLIIYQSLKETFPKFVQLRAEC
jgi:hypothetical protein